MNVPVPSVVSPNRCAHLDAGNRRCRMTVSPNHKTLCGQHALAERQATEATRLAAQLTQTEMKTPAEINFVLAQLYDAVSQRKIDTRQATLLAYIAQLMLQTHKLAEAQPSDLRHA